MKIEREIHAILEKVADDIAAGRRKTHGYVRRARPIRLRATLRDLKRRIEKACSDEWGFPWGLANPTILRMDWRGIPGGGSAWALSALVLPSGRRLYVVDAPVGGEAEPLIVAVAAEDWTPRTDRLLLQKVFRTNGKGIGDGILSSPPDWIVTSVDSFPFLVDAFAALFDAAGKECWDELREDGDAWNEEYEFPEDPIGIPSDVYKKAEAEVILRHGAPARNPASHHFHRQRVEELATALWRKQEKRELLGAVRYEPVSPDDPQVRLRMVARFLSSKLSVDPHDETQPSPGNSETEEEYEDGGHCFPGAGYNFGRRR